MTTLCREGTTQCACVSVHIYLNICCVCACGRLYVSNEKSQRWALRGHIVLLFVNEVLAAYAQGKKKRLHVCTVICVFSFQYYQPSLRSLRLWAHTSVAKPSFGKHSATAFSCLFIMWRSIVVGDCHNLWPRSLGSYSLMWISVLGEAQSHCSRPVEMLWMFMFTAALQTDSLLPNRGSSVLSHRQCRFDLRGSSFISSWYLNRCWYSKVYPGAGGPVVWELSPITGVVIIVHEQLCSFCHHAKESWLFILSTEQQNGHNMHVPVINPEQVFWLVYPSQEALTN